MRSTPRPRATGIIRVPRSTQPTNGWSNRSARARKRSLRRPQAYRATARTSGSRNETWLAASRTPPWAGMRSAPDHPQVGQQPHQQPDQRRQTVVEALRSPPATCRCHQTIVCRGAAMTAGLTVGLLVSCGARGPHGRRHERAYGERPSRTRPPRSGPDRARAVAAHQLLQQLLTALGRLAHAGSSSGCRPGRGANRTG
jgi:hypothetical protein